MNALHLPKTKPISKEPKKIPKYLTKQQQGIIHIDDCDQNQDSETESDQIQVSTPPEESNQNQEASQAHQQMKSINVPENKLKNGHIFQSHDDLIPPEQLFAGAPAPKQQEASGSHINGQQSNSQGEGSSPTQYFYIGQPMEEEEQSESSLASSSEQSDSSSSDSPQQKKAVQKLANPKKTLQSENSRKEEAQDESDSDSEELYMIEDDDYEMEDYLEQEGKDEYIIDDEDNQYYDDDDEQFEDEPIIQQRKPTLTTLNLNMRVRQMTDKCLPLPFQPQIVSQLARTQKYQQVNDQYLARLEQLGGKEDSLQVTTRNISFGEVISLKTFKKQEEVSILNFKQEQRQYINHTEKAPSLRAQINQNFNLNTKIIQTQPPKKQEEQQGSQKNVENAVKALLSYLDKNNLKSKPSLVQSVVNHRILINENQVSAGQDDTNKPQEEITIPTSNYSTTEPLASIGESPLQVNPLIQNQCIASQQINNEGDAVNVEIVVKDEIEKCQS